MIRFAVIGLVAMGVLPVRAAEEQPAGPGFAFVCLKSKTQPDPERLRQALVRWFSLPEESVKGGGRILVGSKPALEFEIGARKYLFIYAGFPVPKADIAYACGNSFLWPEAESVLAGHAAHLVVMVAGKFDSAAGEGLALSRAIAAATESSDAIGVYWGHANVAHEPSAFREMIRGANATMDGLPVVAWVGFLRARGKTGGVDFYTSGLDAFGVMEIEVLDSRTTPGEIVTRLASLSAYLISRGNVIRDGDTVGNDDVEKIKATHEESVIGRKGKVLRIHYP